jgi:hypothetical protein
VARRITVEFLGDAKHLDKTIDGVDGKTSTIGSRLKKFGKVAAAGLAVAGTAAVAGGKYFFDVGSKLEQMGMKAETVFGPQLGNVQKWADESAHAMGLTTREATGLAANFADLLIPMGFTRKQAAGMSTDVVGLSGALSQWSGGTVSAAEASDVLAKAMLGETDGLKALGISISAAEIDARLLKKGQDKLKGAALAQAKAQATQALIMEKSTDAQAAFAKGGAPLLSAQAKLKASLGEVRDEIAVKLVPVFNKFADWFVNTGLPAMKRFGDWLQRTLPPVVAKVRQVFNKVFGGMSKDTSGTFRTLRDIIRDFTKIAQAIWKRFGGAWVSNLKSTLKFLKVALGGGLKILSGVLKVISGIMRGDWAKAWSGIRDIQKGMLRIIVGALRLAFTVIKNLFRVLWTAVKDIVRGAWNGIRDIVRAGADRLMDGIRAIPDRIRNLGGAFASAGRAIIGAFVDGLKNAAGVISGIASSVWSALRSMLNSAIGRINRALEFSIKVGPKSFSINPPDIPMLAKGGIVTRPTLAMIGEAGPEAVVPLSGPHAPRGVGGDFTARVELDLVLDGKTIQTKLLTLKRRNGGVSLGIA